MPKLGIDPHEIRKRGKVRWVVRIPKNLRPQYEGKSRRFFSVQSDASRFAKELNATRNGWIGQFAELHPTIRARLWACYERLGQDVKQIEAAADAWVKRQAITRKPLSEVVQEIMREKRLANRRWFYARELELTLKAFSAGRETRAISDITTEEINAWLNGNGWAAETRRGYLSRVRTLFGFALKRGYVASNPAAHIEKAARDLKPPGILTVDECASLLRVCRKEEPKLLPYCALGLFAGIRPEEIRRLSWEQVRDGWARIEASMSKTRSRRLIEILPPLDAWLALGGDLPPGPGFTKRWRRVRKLAKVTWSHDCMRHSFCSYCLPIHGAVKTSLIAGHSEAILFKHYRELVPKAQAEKFWKLTPEACAEDSQ